VPVVVGDGHVLQLADHLLAEVAGDAGADEGGELAFDDPDDGEQDARKREREDDVEEGLLHLDLGEFPLIHEEVVDHVLLELRRHEFGDDTDDGEGNDNESALRVGAQQFPDTTEDAAFLQAAGTGLVLFAEAELARGAGNGFKAGFLFRSGIVPVVSLLGEVPRESIEPARDLVEAFGKGIGEPEEVLPFAGDFYLEDAAADAGDRAGGFDGVEGESPDLLGPVRVGDDQLTRPAGEPVGFVPALERDVGVDRESGPVGRGFMEGRCGGGRFPGRGGKGIQFCLKWAGPKTE